MRRQPGIALAAAGLGVLGLLADWLLAFHFASAQTADRNVLEGFSGLDRGPIARLADVVPHVSDPQPFVLFALLIVAVALARRRPRLAVGAAVLLLGANLSTQWLKPALSAPRDGGVASGVDAFLWPSGHATASMSLCLAAVLVAPAARRPLVAGAGAVYTLAVTFTLLVAAWHFPSDVIAGYLMAATWTALVVAALWWRDARHPTAAPRPPHTDVRRAVAPALLVAGAGAVVAVLVALARPDAVAEYARAHTTFVLGAGLIAVLALALAAALSAAMTVTRRPAATGSAPAPTAAPRRRWRPGPG